MSDTNVLDMLNTPNTNDDLEPSLFPEGAVVVMDVKTAKIDDELDDAGQAKNQIVFELATCNEEKNSKGGKFPAGYPHTHRISLKAVSKKGRDISELVRQRLAEWQVACGMALPAPFGMPEQYIGKRVTAVMTIDAGDGTFRKQNRIQKFIKPA